MIGFLQIASTFLVTITLADIGQVPAPPESAVRSTPLEWPVATNTTRPWVYWHWMGSAVDSENLTRELKRYADAGLGGAHVIPIYGARGYESRTIKYLSSQWTRMFAVALQEARRLGMNLDMTLGTGWNFGGPDLGDRLANANVVVTKVDLQPGQRPAIKTGPAPLQALMAFEGSGKGVDLLDRLLPDGSLDWVPAQSGVLYAISQKPSGNPVDRAAPGDEGPMLNPFFGEAITHYLKRFDPAFPLGATTVPRAFYHDSYEYVGDWSPDLLAEFEKRRGYRLQDELPVMFGADKSERSRRVQADYRETVSDLLVERFMPPWVNWVHSRGAAARNQAHGSPGNLLDLYAAADIPETEMFNRDREVLVSKMASSAGHVAGRNLVAAETGTWIAEHFTETLGQLKHLVDEMFLSGVNHVFYHGTCYSPDDVPWPGWLFYASTQMNPRNPIWRDVPALNAYISRTQSVLQSGTSDNDLLLYWPIYDLWHTADVRLPHFSVHRREWLLDQPVGPAARRLWTRGYSFDFISDRQVMEASATATSIAVPGGSFRLILVPACRLMPEATLQKLVSLAEGGATVAFERQLPEDVPGWGRLDERRRTFRTLLSKLALGPDSGPGLRSAAVGRGRILVGDLDTMLEACSVRRESLADDGLGFVRRRAGDVTSYLLVNTSGLALDRWVPLSSAGSSAVLMDAMSGNIGVAAVRRASGAELEVRVSLLPGESRIVRVLSDPNPRGVAWRYWSAAGAALPVTGLWQIRPIEGGPEMPRSTGTSTLASWTALDDPEWQRFGGTARYSIQFKTPSPGTAYALDLGRVCQSARLRLNGRTLGTLLTTPFRIDLGILGENMNELEVEVTGTAANRIRDLDRRKVQWKVFHNINFVNIDYKPFDASAWPVHDQGLLGPVTLQPVRTSDAP